MISPSPDHHVNMSRSPDHHQTTIMSAPSYHHHMTTMISPSCHHLYVNWFPKKIFSAFPVRVLAALGLNLELKSKSYVTAGQQALSAIFLLNNYNYILKGLQRYQH
jgi:hypothetical protein